MATNVTVKTIQTRRSKTAGYRPAVLLDGEPFTNLADGVNRIGGLAADIPILVASSAEAIAGVANKIITPPSLAAAMAAAIVAAGTVGVFVDGGQEGGTAPPVTSPLGALGIFNVLDYGADKTGAANSMMAFQSALDAIAATATGGILYVPPGAFTIGGPLTFSSTNKALYIQGVGRGMSVIIQATAGSLFTVSGNGRFQMENLFVLQAAAGGSFLALKSAAEYVIRNIRAYASNINSYWDTFFNVTNPLLGSIQDIYARNTPEGYNTEQDISKLRGTGFLGVASAISVLNSFHNCYFAGFYTAWWFQTTAVPGNEGNYFSNCTVEASRIGVRYQNSAYSAPQPVSWVGGHMNCYERCFLLEGCSDPHIIGGLFYRNVVYNISGQHIFMTTNNGNPATGAMIANNTFRVVGNASGKDAGGVAAVHLDGGDWHTVASNKFDLSPGFAYAVFVSGINADITLNRSRGGGLSGTGVTVTGSGGYSIGNRCNGGTPG